jgi:type I restriction enzyme, S subunit
MEREGGVMEGLPGNWASCRLGDLLTFEYGKSLTKSARSGDGQYPVFGSSGVVGLHDAYLVEGPVIIVGRKGAAGSVSYSETNCWPIDTTYYIRNAQFLSSKFVFYLLHSLNLAKLETSTAIPGLNRERAYDEAVLLPPLAEQHRIVAKIEELFSELDQGVASLKTAREQLKVYRQSLLKNAFEGKLTAAWRAAHRDQLEPAAALQQRIACERQARYQQQLADWQTAGQSGPKPKPPKPLPPLTAKELAELPELPAGWGWVKLGELTWSVKDGPHFSPKYSESGVPFISGGNVRPEGIDFTKAKFISPELHEELSKRCKPDRGDLLYTKGGTTGIARVNTYDVDFNVWVHVAVLKLTEAVLPFYVQHALNSSFCYSQAQKYTHGVGNQDLGLTRMVNIVLAACSLSEQEQVIQIVDDKMSLIDQLDQTLATALQQADALRQSILKKAFCGQLEKQDKNEEPATALLERIRAARSTEKPARRGRSASSQL